MLVSIADRKRRLGLVDPEIEHFPRTNPNMLFAYVRMSTKKQENSIEVQTISINSYCKAKNLGDPVFIPERKKSGTDWTRPELLKLINTLVDGDIIIANDLSRIARNTQHWLQFTDNMKLKNVRVICIKENIDVGGAIADTAISKMFRTLSASLAELEAGQISERTKAALAKLKAEGKLRTKPFFGWTYDDEGKTIEIPTEQAVIDFITTCIFNDPNIKTAQITRLINGEIKAGRLNYKNHPLVRDTQIARIIKRNILREVRDKEDL